MGLETYERKRDFHRTPEPRTGRRRPPGSPRSFVIQKHDARALHYDLRLEHDGVLLSWAVPKGPSLDPADRRLAMEVEDHPLDYAGFEGVIPRGEYGGGTVLVWDRGTWRPDGDVRAALKKGSLSFTLEGEKLRGGWRLVRLRKDPRGKQPWLLLKRRDAEARSEGPSITAEQTTSVLSGRGLEEIAAARERVWRSNRSGGPGGEEPAPESKTKPPRARAGPLPRAPRPQLATLADAPPEGPGWLHEVKLDGYRLLVRVEGGRVRLLTRSGQDWTGSFPRIAAAAAALPCRSALLDGEAVVLDERGVSDFQRLQRTLADGTDQARLVAFDLLHLDGLDLTPSPLVARKAALRRLLAGPRPGADDLRFGDHLGEDGQAVLAQACELGLEGIVSKRADSAYALGARAKSWLKVKCHLRQDLAVIGYTEGEGSRTGFGALVLGVPAGVGWRLAGRVGTGFDARERDRLLRRLEPLRRPTSPVTPRPRGAAARGVRWVEPRLVVEVAFAGWTDDGHVRQASYRGLREDLPASEVRRETAGASHPGPRKARGGRVKDGAEQVGPVRITNPGRVLFPESGVTKGDVARYYALVAERLVALAKDRPLTLLRCPEGRAKCFFQKHARTTFPGTIPRVHVPGEARDFLSIDGPEALLALAQHGVLELHLWGSRKDRLDRPDRLVLDLDPGPEVPWKAVALGAQLVRDRLRALDLPAYLLSTGGNGLHVVAPVRRTRGWEPFKGFAAAFAADLARELPDVFTDKLARRGREGKLFLDYLRNGFGASAVAPYSVRARPGAPVAAPLAWEELRPDGPAPRFTVADGARLASRPDPWADYGEALGSLPAGLRQRKKSSTVKSSSSE